MTSQRRVTFSEPLCQIMMYIPDEWHDLDRYWTWQDIKFDMKENCNQVRAELNDFLVDTNTTDTKLLREARRKWLRTQCYHIERSGKHWIVYGGKYGWENGVKR